MVAHDCQGRASVFAKEDASSFEIDFRTDIHRSHVDHSLE